MLAALASPLYIILGIVVVAGTVVTGVLLLARWIFSANEHNINTCDCADCRRRRHLAVERRKAEEGQPSELLNTKQPNPKYARALKSGIISTTRLRQGDVVYVRDTLWRVTGIMASRSGVVVALQNLETGKMSFNPVKREMFDTPMWRVRPTDWKMPKRPE